MDDVKSSHKISDIRCRVDENTKKVWCAVCQKNAVNGSELLRRFIVEYIKANS